MVSKGDERRTRIFRRYSANLALWRPELEGHYVCPLCLQSGFEEHDALGPNPRLTEEHCIPKGLGKTSVVLTCDTCNSAAGRSVDNHLYKRVDFNEFWKGTLDETLQARITMLGHDLGVEVRRSTGKTDVQVQEVTSDPAKIRAVQDSLADGASPSGFKLRFGTRNVPDTKRSRIAVLKSAYLLMFRHFGYGYILSPVLNAVREQISNPNCKAVPLESVLFNVPAEHLGETINAIVRPENLGGFGVSVPLRKRGVGYFIIMPRDGNTFDCWSAYAAGRDRTQTIRISYNGIPFDESLLTQQLFNWESSGPAR